MKKRNSLRTTKMSALHPVKMEGEDPPIETRRTRKKGCFASTQKP